MAIHLRNTGSELAVRKLAARLGVTLTEAIRVAAVNELAHLNTKDAPLAERLRKIQSRVASCKPTGLLADKAFFDSL